MISPIRKLIGSRIKMYRKNNGVTQATLAEAAGCEVTTLGRYERGEFAPDGEQLVRMALYFGVSPMVFLPGMIDIQRMEILELRSTLIDLIHSMDDSSELKRLIAEAKKTSKKNHDAR